MRGFLLGGGGVGQPVCVYIGIAYILGYCNILLGQVYHMKGFSLQHAQQLADWLAKPCVVQGTQTQVCDRAEAEERERAGEYRTAKCRDFFRERRYPAQFIPDAEGHICSCEKGKIYLCILAGRTPCGAARGA